MSINISVGEGREFNGGVESGDFFKEADFSYIIFLKEGEFSAVISDFKIKKYRIRLFIEKSKWRKVEREEELIFGVKNLIFKFILNREKELFMRVRWIFKI